MSEIIEKYAPADKTDTQLQAVFTPPRPGAILIREDWADGAVRTVWLVPEAEDA